MSIRKAVIPAAGLGTRFLPATKAMPKEMLPIVDTPTIQYIVEEAVKSGIEDIVVITGRSKRAIEDHFDKSVELELSLEKHHKDELLREVEAISNLVHMIYVRQKEPLGLGHAILMAKEVIGNEPFAVLLGDDVVRSDTPALRQLMDQYEKCHSPILGVRRVAPEETNKYGIVRSAGDEGRMHLVNGLVEKPAPEEAPSNLAIMGRYILTPQIFDVLEKTQSGAGGEIQLTDALEELRGRQDVYAYEFDGKRYDVGDKLGFLQATCEFALEREDLKDQFAQYIRTLAKSIGEDK